MKKALITGVSGFAGSHLAEYLVRLGTFEVLGTYLTESNVRNIESVKDKIHLFKVNLLNYQDILAVLKNEKPDYIFHLAALTSVAKSFDHPLDTIVNNVTSQINLLEAIKKSKLFETKILVITSSNVYGQVLEKDLPINENVEFRPNNPYAVSKITQDYLGLEYFLSSNLKIIRIRPFNHIGPRLSSGISVSRFAKKIAEIEKGKSEPKLMVGNLATKRDFTDVRDIVKGYVLSLEKCDVGDAYNIGSGVSFTIKNTLDKLLSLTKVKVDVQIDQSLFRPSDIPELLCDVSKFKAKTGWQPTIPIDQSLKDLLDYWREIV